MSNSKFKIVELFESIDGEGKRAGQLASFVRLAGCNLRCSYCDTLYALFDENEECRFSEMTADNIVLRLRPEVKNVTLTGGEPLVHPSIPELIRTLVENGFQVNIETNGAVDIQPLLDEQYAAEQLFLTIDYKLPSSAMEAKMIARNFQLLRPFDVLKLVIGSPEDASRCIEVVKDLTAFYAQNSKQMPLIYLGAVHGAFPEKEIVRLMQTEPVLAVARLQLQMHKIVWNAQQRGV